VTLPGWLAAVLLPDARRAWHIVQQAVPAEAYLGGGTAIAVHLRHRVSRDLDLFLEAPVDLERLRDELDRRGELHVTMFEPTPGRQTLNGYLGATKLQVLESSSLRLMEPTTQVEGLRVAGIGDLLAMKLKVIRERGELRDYFDVLVIERDAHRTVEEGIALALKKYRPQSQQQFVESLVRALGYLDDVEEDPGVPMPKAEISRYWATRLRSINANLSRQA
jgi:predicted nucleotidyltransferase component of viral defense system